MWTLRLKICLSYVALVLMCVSIPTVSSYCYEKPGCYDLATNKFFSIGSKWTTSSCFKCQCYLTLTPLAKANHYLLKKRSSCCGGFHAVTMPAGCKGVLDKKTCAYKVVSKKTGALCKSGPISIVGK